MAQTETTPFQRDLTKYSSAQLSQFQKAEKEYLEAKKDYADVQV